MEPLLGICSHTSKQLLAVYSGWMVVYVCVCVRLWVNVHVLLEVPWPPNGKQLSGVRERGVRLTQGSICNWEVLVSDSAVINHPRPILFFDSSVQGLTFNTHDPGPGCARDQRLQKTQKLNRMTPPLLLFSKVVKLRQSRYKLIIPICNTLHSAEITA